MDINSKRLLGYKDDEKTAYEIGKEKGLPDPVFNTIIALLNETDKRFKERGVYDKARECKQIVDDLADTMIIAKR
jgi:hypothetical protein